jgi:hypothetical protein
MGDPLAELAGYFRCRSEVPDAELVRLVAGARAGGSGWDAIAVGCGVRDYHDITGVVGLPCWEASDTGAELLFSAVQSAMHQLTGGRGLFRPLRWLCPSCGQQVADRAPAGRPVHVEHGHAPGCARLSGDQARRGLAAAGPAPRADRAFGGSRRGGAAALAGRTGHR